MSSKTYVMTQEGDQLKEVLKCLCMHYFLDEIMTSINYCDIVIHFSSKVDNETKPRQIRTELSFHVLIKPSVPLLIIGV